MKMPTIVGIFIFISRENFMLSWDKHEKSFITPGTDQFLRCPHEEFCRSWLSKNAPSEDSKQTSRMQKLIWIFCGRTPEGTFSDVAGKIAF